MRMPDDIEKAMARVDFAVESLRNAKEISGSVDRVWFTSDELLRASLDLLNRIRRS